MGVRRGGGKEGGMLVVWFCVGGLRWMWCGIMGVMGVMGWGGLEGGKGGRKEEGWEEEGGEGMGGRVGGREGRGKERGREGGGREGGERKGEEREGNREYGVEEARTDIKTHTIRKISPQFDKLRSRASALVSGEDGEECQD